MRASEAILQAADLLGDERAETKSDCGRRLKSISRCKPPKIFAPGYRPPRRGARPC